MQTTVTPGCPEVLVFHSGGCGFMSGHALMVLCYVHPRHSGLTHLASHLFVGFVVRIMQKPENEFLLLRWRLSSDSWLTTSLSIQPVVHGVPQKEELRHSSQII